MKGASNVILGFTPFVLAYFALFLNLGEERFFRRRFSEYKTPGIADEEQKLIETRAYFIAKVASLRFQPIIAFITSMYVAIEAPRELPLIYVLPLTSGLLGLYTVALCDRITLRDYLAAAFPRKYPSISGRRWIGAIQFSVVTVAFVLFLLIRVIYKGVS